MISSITSNLHEIGLGDIRTDTAEGDTYVWLGEAVVIRVRWRQLNPQRLEYGLTLLKLA